MIDESSNLNQKMALPVILVELSKLFDVPEPDLDDVASFVEKDVVLAGKFVETANSKIFRSGSKITSVRQAIGIVGLKASHILVFTAVLRTGTCYDDTGWEVRRRALVNAVASKRSLSLIGSNHADEGFLVGLMGCLASMFGLPGDPDIVSAELLESWGFPAFIVDALISRHDVLDLSAPPEMASLNLGLRMGLMVEEVLCNEISRGTSLAVLIGFCEKHLSWDAKQVSDFVLELEEDIAELSEMFEVSHTKFFDHSRLLSLAVSELAGAALSVAVTRQQVNETIKDLEMRNRALATAATQDSLTKLLNHKSGTKVVADAFNERRNGLNRRGCLGLIFLDVDHFKAVNDLYGHVAGDQVLQAVSRVLVECTRRENEYVVRPGGEEFMVVMTESTPEMVKQTADRIRQNIESTVTVVEDQEIRVTVSVGGSFVYSTDGLTEDDLLKSADAKMYVAKQEGRNQVFMSSKPLVFSPQ